MPKKNKMAERPQFIEQLKSKWDEGKFVCVGLDLDYEKIPPHIIKASERLPYLCEEEVGTVIRSAFMREIVNATGDLVCAFKPNIAFFEDSPEGEAALVQIVEHIHQRFPHVPVIGDVKRADIGNSNGGYARMAFERYDFDAITISPYLGSDTYNPYLSYEGRGLLVLCRTTNLGSDELQERQLWRPDLDERLLTKEEITKLDKLVSKANLKVYELVAFLAEERWNKSGNFGLVVGATHPEAFGSVRRLAPTLPLLIPGIGTQGGDLEKTLRYAPDNKGQGMIINSSSGIIYASSGEDFAEAARAATLKLHNQITKLRTKNG